MNRRHRLFHRDEEGVLRSDFSQLVQGQSVGIPRPTRPCGKFDSMCKTAVAALLTVPSFSQGPVVDRLARHLAGSLVNPVKSSLGGD